MGLLNWLDHTAFSTDGFSWTAPLITPGDGQILAIAFGISINPPDLGTLSIVEFTTDAGDPGYTETPASFASLSYQPVYLDPRFDGNAAEAQVYVSAFAGILPVGATEITIANVGFTNPLSRVGAMFWTIENGVQFFPVDSPPADFSEMINGGAGPVATPQVSPIAGFWVSWLAGIGAFDTDPITPSLGASIYRLGPDPPDTTDASGSGGFGNGFWQPSTPYFPMWELTGTGFSSSPSTWTFDGDFGSSGGQPADSWWAGRELFFCIIPIEIDPFPPDPEPGEGIDDAPRLHIPHKEYAFSLEGMLHKYTANWTTIEQWANKLRCSGVIDGPGEGETTTFTPTNAGWKETRLHIPNKTTFTARHIHENYLAFERWARLVCPMCHIPHKEWMATYKNPQQELVNLLTIERWARDIGRCCGKVVEGGGGG